LSATPTLTQMPGPTSQPTLRRPTRVPHPTRTPVP
jgi:hypothetical protein